MSEFKIGDRVRIVREFESPQLKSVYDGMTGTIEAIFPTCTYKYFVRLDEGGHATAFYEVEHLKKYPVIVITTDGVTTTGYATRARLLDVAITMANMQTIETYVIDDGNLNLVIDEICADNRAKIVEPMTEDAEGEFLMEKLTTVQAASADKVGNLVAFEGTVTKVEYDANGVLGAIHVDDGSGEVVIFLDGYINCSDACGKDAQGYHDLSWVK